MAFNTKLSVEEAAIRLKEAEVERNTVGVWLCLGAAVVLGCLGVFAYASSSGGYWALAVLMGFLCLFFARLSFTAWEIVCRDRKLLAQLWADASEVSAEQPGVWPPPPHATD